MFLRKIFLNIKKSIFVIVSISCILLFSLIISGIISEAKQSILDLNGALTNNHVKFTFHEHQYTEEESKSINEDSIKSNITLKNQNIKTFLKELNKNENISIKNNDAIIFGSGLNAQALYINGKYDMHYNLLQGRFLQSSDFNNGKKIAVIGKDVLKETQTEGNRKYITRGTDKYEVVGVIGYENKPSTWDSYVLFNLDSLFQNDVSLPNQGWTLDSFALNEQDLTSLVENASKNFDEDFVTVDGKETTLNPLNMAIFNTSYITMYFLIIILCIFISLIKSIFIWFEKLHLELGVRCSVGATFSDITILLLKRYSLNCFVSILFTIFIYLLLIKTAMVDFKTLGINPYSVINIYSLLSSFILLIIIGVLTIIISLSKLKKLKLSYVLKEK